MSAADTATRSGSAATLVLVSLFVFTAPAAAQTGTPQPTAGIEMVRIADREYPRVRVADGRWWYLAPSCPWPSAQVPADAVCGGDQAILRDDAELRCTFIVNHRRELSPQRATWRFCLTRPPLSPAYHWTEEQNERRIDQVRTAVGSCVGTNNGCMAMQWWPRAGDGTIDCAAIPRDKLGDALTSASSQGTDRRVIDRTCAVLNSYLARRAFPSGVTAADLNLAGRVVADGVPIGTATGSMESVVDWGKVGDSVDALCSIPANVLTMGTLCVGATAAQAGAKLWGAMDCATEFDKCLAEAAARAMLTGLELTLDALRHPTAVDFDDPGLRSVLGAIGTVSAYLVLLLFLVNAVIAAVRMRTRELAEGALGLVRWAFGLGVGLTLVALAVFVSDRVADWFAGATAGTSEVVYARFFSLMYTLATSGGANATGWLFVMVVCLLGAFASGIAYLLLIFRKGAIVLAVALMVLQLAGGAGPKGTRKWSRKGLSVLWACIIAKPLTVIVFRLGETWIGQGRGLGDLLLGVGTLGVAAVAPFVVVKWFPLDGGPGGGSSRGSLAMTTAAALSMVANRGSTATTALRSATSSTALPAGGAGVRQLPAGHTPGPRSSPAGGVTISTPPRNPSAGRPVGAQQVHRSATSSASGMRSVLTSAAIAGAVGAVAGQVAMDGVTSGGADDSPYPDHLPYLPLSTGASRSPVPGTQEPGNGPSGPATGGGRW
ncbi:hypothetical protein ABZ816_35610 [Actinosynnema sp. NPDC047251]|uniref:Putative secreted protein n=1 Tax=Saccharothrix espanaensis (strain ATCC 51144 / DSM 44229 / JCM 9112 / NBRC 15066 / NRRL 15764) TaxID=1179773 RepID=K0JPY6_SACES|nr:putative secreted protein [Saccharothrix espanaensis DSM 44229]